MTAEAFDALRPSACAITVLAVYQRLPVAYAKAGRSYLFG
jgi:hypothetical protein